MQKRSEESVATSGPVDRWTHILTWLGVALFVAFWGWASIRSLDVVSVSVGQVIPSSQVKQIQHLEGGIVSKILVSEGQVVKADQPLIELEPTRSQAEVDELSLRIAALKTSIARLDAEADQLNEVVFDTDIANTYPDLVEKSQALFGARKERLDSEMRVQEILIAERRQNISEVEARLGKSRALLGHISEQVTISKSLLAKKLSNRMKHLELLRQLADTEGDIAIYEASLSRVRLTIEEAEAKLVSIRSGFIEDVREERAREFRSLRELSERLVRLQDSLIRTIVRAPVDGIVKTLNVTTEGGVVKPGGTILELVPSDDKLVIEAQLPIQDIGFVSVGQEAHLSLASADAQLFDKLIGQVTQISPDTLITDKGIAFYKVRIETDRPYFERGAERYNLYPGIQVQASIRTGQRTVLEYVFSPVFKTANSALQER